MKRTLNDSIVVILDDHEFFGDAFGKQIKELGLFKDVYSFTKERELAQFFADRNTGGPVFVVANYLIGGHTVIPVIDKARPLCKDLYLIITSTITNALMIKDMLRNKANGIINKISDMQEFMQCIRQIEQGSVYLSENIRSLLQEYEGKKLVFSTREIEILRYMAEGLALDSIAEKLQLSYNAVFAYREKMFQKTQSNNTAELLAYIPK